MMNIDFKYSFIVAVISVLLYVLLVKLIEPSIKSMNNVGSITDVFSTCEFYMFVSIFVGYNFSKKYLSNI